MDTDEMMEIMTQLGRDLSKSLKMIFGMRTKKYRRD